MSQGTVEQNGSAPNGAMQSTYLEVGDRLDPIPLLPSEDVLRN